MALQFKTIPQAAAPVEQKIERRIVPITLLGTPLGQPLGLPARAQGIGACGQQGELPPPPMPGEGLKRAINYYADYAGCGWWRMIAPELLINIDNKGIINGLTTMVIDPRFYQGISAVRLQRQATPTQLQFFNFLKEHQQTHGFKTIYEIDDVIFKDDIPDFNRCKVAFENEDILRSSLQMMRMSDEISVTCQFMKEYYIDKTGNKNITVIPNYPAKMWMDNHYDINRLMREYTKNKKKPRIAYIGSGTHIDVANRVNQKDDFAHVVDAIIKTRDIIRWVFIGCFPLPCKPFIDRGEMEFIQWYPLKVLAKAYTETNCQAVFAPLVDCTFNRAKSNIKFLEAACCGLPGTFQDMCTYKDAFSHFTTGDELVDQLRVILKDEQVYQNYIKKSRAYADTMWLDDHLDEFAELYFTRIGDPERRALLKLNPDQATITTYKNNLLSK